MKNLIFFFFYLIFNPRLIPLILKGVYLPIYVQFEWLKKYKIKTIIDVGSYRGEVAKSLSYLFPKATVYTFEPNKKNLNVIRKNLSSRKLILSNLALSAKEGSSQYYEYIGYPELSSLLRLGKIFKRSYRINPRVKKTSIKISTLDNYFRNKYLKTDILLKIDTQGTEWSILRGGGKFINKVLVIVVELSFEEYYKGQQLFPEIYKLLSRSGFRYLGETRESEFYPTFGIRNQINGVFINSRMISQGH